VESSEVLRVNCGSEEGEESECEIDGDGTHFRYSGKV
jgi:hypothetical protein